MENSLLRLPKVMARTGLSRTTLYELISDGQFPEPVKLTIRSVAWSSVDVDLWIKRKIENSRKNSSRKNQKPIAQGGVK